jgi:hypothetical protein
MDSCRLCGAVIPKSYRGMEEVFIQIHKNKHYLERCKLMLTEEDYRSFCRNGLSECNMKRCKVCLYPIDQCHCKNGVFEWK